MAVVVLVVVVFLAVVMAENVVTVRPNNATEQFLIDCQTANHTQEQCERKLNARNTQLNDPWAHVVEPFWYNHTSRGIIGGIVATVGYGIFVTIRYLRRKHK